MIAVGAEAKVLKKYYDDVAECARFHDPYVQPMFNNLPIIVVRKPKQTLESLWPVAKEYI